MVLQCLVYRKVIFHNIRLQAGTPLTEGEIMA